MDEQNLSPVLDGIIGDIAESGTLDLTGYPPEVLIVAVRESFQQFGVVLEQLHGVYTTLGLLMGELDERISPPDPSQNGGS